MSATAPAALDPPVVVEPSKPATAAVVWLHGLGADGHDFEPVAAELARGGLDDVRYVFPPCAGASRHHQRRDGDACLVRHRGTRARAPGGRRGRAGLGRHRPRAGGRAGRARRSRAAHRSRGVLPGGAIALHAGLRFPFRIAGILALSTYLPAAHSLASQAHDANRDVPIFLAHGSQDPVIALALSERSRAAMSDLGYVVEVHTYPMPHSVCPEEVRDIASWLSRVLRQR